MGWHYVLCEISILTKKTIMKKETALKILRELHAQALFSERTALETLIPELKESKDEKNRIIKKVGDWIISPGGCYLHILDIEAENNSHTTRNV